MRTINKSQLLFFVIILFGIFMFMQTVFAQSGSSTITPKPDEGVVIDFGGDDNKFIFPIFEPTFVTDLRKYGVLRFASYILVLSIAWFMIYTAFNLVRYAYKFLQKESDDMTEGMRGAEGTIRAVGYTLAMLFAYILISTYLGMGNLFKWPLKLSQCGDGTFLFRAEYSAQLVNPDIFEDETMIYCCKSFSSVLSSDETEKAIDIGGAVGNAAVVGDPEKGGWLFISDPNGEYQNTLPANIGGAEGCEKFTI